MKQYLTYQKTNLEYLGDVPKNWKRNRIKYCFHIINGGVWGDDPKTDDNDIICVRVADFNYESGNIDTTNLTIRNISKTEQRGRLLKKGDLLLEKSGGGEMSPVGRVVKFDLDDYAVCSNFINRLNTKQCFNSDFLNYLFKYLYAKGVSERCINQTTGIQNLKVGEFVAQTIYLPDAPEQLQIVKYLDYKTNLIDGFIAKRQRQIELLREQKTSIINKAVTKGIDPDAKLKPSGIEWFGETPEHWEIKKIKHIKAHIKNAFVDGPFGSNLKSEHFVDDGTVLVIESGFITSGEFILSDFKKITKGHFETIKRSEAKAGDIIIAKIGFNYGMSGILPELGALSVVSGNSLKLTVDEKRNITKYIHYLFLYLKKEGAFEVIVKETAQPALSLTRLNNVSIAIPDREEQQQILDYLKIETSKLEDLISKYQKQIELMQEYRTGIISQAVTGKIDVRDWKPKTSTQ